MLLPAGLLRPIALLPRRSANIFRAAATAPTKSLHLQPSCRECLTTTLRKTFDTPGPVLVGVHVDYRQNVKLFEQVYEGSIL
ncbi:MAG: hypothetical protein JWO71_735 [Candidatus Acidoferrum typicum]|nr:hypothetical protein [Candidatus Acidoferrum typicum]